MKGMSKQIVADSAEMAKLKKRYIRYGVFIDTIHIQVDL